MAGFILLLNHNHTLKCLQLYASFFLHNEEHSALNDMLSDPKSIISKLSLCGAHCSLRPNQNSLVISPSLCHLQFVGPNFMTQQDWQEVRDVVSSPYTALTVLEVDACSIDDASADALSAGLVHSNTLEWVVLSTLMSITVHGWLSILSSLQNSNSTLKHILLHNSDTINDEVVSMFGEVLAAKKNIVKGFRLSSCTSITAAGWTALSVALLTPMLKLRKLVIGNSNFDDDALVAFTNVLCNKPSLRIMDLGNSNVTRRGWEAISKVLCDASSLEAIRQSNHTLHDIATFPDTCPPNIKELLKINRRGSPSDVIRLKMIKYSDKITMDSLVNVQPEVQLKLVPSVISYLGKDDDRHTALKNFVRNQSHLLGRGV